MARENWSNTVRRSLKMIELMAGRYFDGLSNKELAEALGELPSTISRDVLVLESEGWLRKLENGRWGLTVKPLQIMQAYANHAELTGKRLSETTHNIASGARRYMGD
ncbi:hypothetical protein LJC36_00090 [Desulfovibrio sp. OttesenSCG-928-C14]|nr:hypothetical protein [Desulfovibrio sp. OttesenSCG-928-C14]